MKELLKHDIPKLGKVLIKPEEQELLKIIYELKQVSLYQLKYYSYDNFGTKNGTLESRMKKFQDKNILSGRFYPNKEKSHPKFYQISEEGINILKRIKYIPSDVEENTSDIQGKKSYDHLFPIRDVVLQTLTHAHPTKIQYDYSKDNLELVSGKEGETFVVPDWIIRSEHATLCIEVDTGSERSFGFTKKVKGYKKLSKARPHDTFHVLFAIPDRLDQRIFYVGDVARDRRKRVSNIKDKIIKMNAHNLPNMNFYIVPLSRAGIVGSKIMKGEYPFNTTVKIQINSDFIRTLDIHRDNSFDYKYTYLNASDFYLADVHSSLYADEHYLFRNNSQEFTVLIKYMEEGSVRCLDQLRYLQLLAKEGRFKKRVDFVLGLYDKEMEMKMDYFGTAPFDVAVLSSIETLTRDGITGNNPMTYHMKNNIVTKEVPLYEK